MAGINLGTAYVQVMPSAKGIKGSIANVLSPEAESAGNSAGQTIGTNLVQMIKKVVVAAGIGKFVRDSMNEAGALQQTYMGGLDTIYGEAADSARNYAKEAAKAGISMNEYAEQAIGFGASLRQAFAGDTAKAAEAANTAIMDMADNAAKMGTPLQSIQNAYQGFAKQNYTMLDNLKLGFGGTKTEMLRLLETANEINKKSGKITDYQISNLGDVYEAIHVVQGELGLTGVAAAEAEGTFTGSMGAMRASIKNLMGNLALGNDISKDLEIVSVSLRTFVSKNMLPLLGNVLKAIPTLIKKAIPELVSFVSEMARSISANAKEIRKAAVDLVRHLVTGIINALPELISAGVEMIGALKEAFASTPWDSIARVLLINLKNAMEDIVSTIFGDGDIITTIVETLKTKATEALTLGTTIIGKIAEALTKALPTILAVGRDIFSAVVTGIVEMIPTLAETASSLLGTLIQFIVDNLPRVLLIGTDLLRSLIDGVVAAIPMLLDLAVDLIDQLVTFIAENLPMLLDIGVQLLMQLAEGIAAALPDLIEAITVAVSGVLQTIVENLPKFIENGAAIIGSLAEGILSVATHIPEIMLELFSTAWELIIHIDWLGLGKSIIDAIANGTIAVASKVWNAIKNIATTAWNDFKKIEWVQLGIHAIKTIVEGLKSIGATIASALKEIAQNGLSGVKNINWASLGSNIISGIVSGLRAAGSAITSFLTSLAKSALNSVKRFLGIASPSKVFRDQIGKNIVLGIADGIEDNVDAVTDAMDDIAAESVLAIEPTAIAATPAPDAGIGGVVNNITINPSAGMDEEALADMVIQRITFTMRQAQAAWG